jgi:ubiquitin carboxyl-terminal hydrolase 40
MELDMAEFIEDGSEQKYELFAVVIHRGNAHSGHYHAYIHDLLKYGNWTPAETKEPEPVETKDAETSTPEGTSESAQEPPEPEEQPKGKRGRRKGRNK